MFNGTKVTGAPRVKIDETNIAWESDIKYKFKNAENWQDI